ncbi:magnesium transporter [Caldalkalibacillus salinus]|uniref:magnesium transporter n=1 Tax=Caldalkalibacillus salinus TaxID=2803787 RepID=UPI001924C42B|nr:magnesium transporter [Caldalkalibacillus salinus]
MVKLNQDNREQYTNAILRALTDHNIHDFREQFLSLHPTDQIEVTLHLSKKQRGLVYKYLDPSEFAEIFQGLEINDQRQIFNELAQNYAVDMIGHMYSDDLADFLAELPEEKKRLFLSKMSKEDAEEVQHLLKYPEQTAGAIMTTEYISISVSDSVQDVLNLLRLEGPDAETIYYLYVTDEDRKLVGVLSLRDLIISPLETKLEDIMSTRVVSVDVKEDQENVASMIQKYDFLAIPVTLNQRLAGIITVDDIIDVLEEETTEDFGEITAAKGAVDLDIGPVEAAKKRVPWLVMLLFIGMFTAGIIGQFEETLSEHTVLAFFIPLIAGMAGNTGTQSLAGVVRGLALGKLDRPGIVRLLKRELGTGVIIGIVCGIVVAINSQFVPNTGLTFGFIIGFSLFVTLVVATLAGSTIPLIINKLKIDPAVASGPFITTINDIVALLIYFSIATAFLSHL